jgi:AraC family transcriptional regulator
MQPIQPVPYHLVTRPAFRIAGRQTFISGPDNDQFGRFWADCRAQGWLARLDSLKQSTGWNSGPQTAAAYLGVSRVEADPTNRAFYYMIAIEVPADLTPPDLEVYAAPACTWAVFECHGQAPLSIVNAEMFAFLHWLPTSGYHHALAPEMEVYPANRGEDYSEFWLPVES